MRGRDPTKERFAKVVSRRMDLMFFDFQGELPGGTTCQMMHANNANSDIGNVLLAISGISISLFSLSKGIDSKT